MEFNIRPAVKEDCPRMMELVLELAIYEKAPQEVTVHFDHFGNGVGKLLMDRLIEECKVKKFSGMVWQVLEWNEPAINFYKKYKAHFDGEWINCAINFQ